jgi:hypothetical protein
LDNLVHLEDFLALSELVVVLCKVVALARALVLSLAQAWMA